MERGELSRGPDHAFNFFFFLLSLLLHRGHGTEATYCRMDGWRLGMLADYSQTGKRG